MLLNVNILNFGIVLRLFNPLFSNLSTFMQFYINQGSEIKHNCISVQFCGQIRFPGMGNLSATTTVAM